MVRSQPVCCALALLLVGACSSQPVTNTHQNLDGGGSSDAGSSVDAGTRAGPDAGSANDAGMPQDAGSVADAGTPADGGAVADAGAPTDGGTSDGGMTSDGGSPADGGMVTPLPVNLPANTDTWKFYGPSSGGPNQVYGASMDEGGNLWVAGGEQGLYLMRAGSTTFEQFTMADGLRPYGYMPDGSTPPGDKYLKVISVSGGPAGTVFVGYEGKPPGPGQVDCESNWDSANPDPSIYKSGDADKVTLTGTGISVVHYDIFSGPGIVGGELRGREKLCNILRIRYDKVNNKVWFGANHGFAMGEADYQGNANCQWEPSNNPPTPTSKTDPMSNEYGHEGCNGLLEHTHPAFNGYYDDTSGNCCAYLTGGYYGVSVDPLTHDIWFGGQMRTTKFHYATTGGNYYQAESETEDGPYIANRIDIWPDKVEEPNIPRPSDRVDDFVSGAAAMNDGTVWISSFKWGLAHLDATGTVLARMTMTDGLAANKLSALAADPLDQSVWAGTNWGPGISRLQNGTFIQYGPTQFGFDLANEGVSDIQSFGTGASRVMIVSFQGDPTHAGAVALYSGP